MSVKRILHIVPSLGLANGVTAVVMNWYRQMDKSKVQFDFLVCYHREESFEQEIINMGGRVFNLPSPKKLPLFLKKAWQVFKNGNYQTVHSHITQYNFFFFPMAKLAKVQNILLHSHNTKFSDFKIRAVFAAAMTACIKNMADKKVACSEKAGDFLFGKNAKYTIINNALDCRKFAYNPQVRAEIRAELGLEETDFLLGHIGRFCEQKNHLFLIDIFQEIVKKTPSARLVLAGIGPTEELARAKVEALNLSDKVKFLGIYSAPQRLYQAMDAFVLPSLYEGLPVVGIEAQAAGLPCFFADTITRQAALCNVTFLPLNNAAKWADSILQTCAQFQRKDTSPQIKQAGFDIQSVSEKVLSLYETDWGQK